VIGITADAATSSGMLYWALSAAAGAVAIALLALGWKARGESGSLGVGLLRAFTWGYLRVVHRVRLDLADPLPPSGPAILVANHRSSIDPFVVAAFTLRRVRFLMAKEYYETTGLRWFFRWMRAIPVKRDGNDLSATKVALRALADGEVIGIFPEGGIRNDTASTPFAGKEGQEAVKHGAALFALRTGAPLYTAYVSGTPPLDSVFLAFFRPSKSSVSFAGPLAFEKSGGGKATREDLENASGRIVESILEMQRRVEGGAASPPGAVKPTSTERRAESETVADGQLEKS
jgi:1-acyl-sn-glycerol-3-phosphate acyltransferase